MTDDPHPEWCRLCRGAGYVDGPRIVQNRAGQTVGTVKPCQHPWWNDDPDQRPEPIQQSSEQAQAAIARGIAQGLAELDAMRPKDA